MVDLNAAFRTYQQKFPGETHFPQDAQQLEAKLNTLPPDVRQTIIESITRNSYEAVRSMFANLIAKGMAQTSEAGAAARVATLAGKNAGTNATVKNHPAMMQFVGRSAETSGRAEMMRTFENQVAGQDAAKKDIIDKLLMHRAKPARGLESQTAMALVGPPSSGKMELVKAIATAVSGDPRAYVEIDGSRLLNRSDLESMWHGAVPDIAARGSAALDVEGALGPTARKRLGATPVIAINDFDLVAPEVRNDLGARLVRLIESGMVDTRFKGKPPVDWRGAIVVFIGSDSRALPDALRMRMGKDIQTKP